MLRQFHQLDQQAQPNHEGGSTAYLPNAKSTAVAAATAANPTSMIAAAS